MCANSVIWASISGPSSTAGRPYPFISPDLRFISGTYRTTWLSPVGVPWMIGIFCQMKVVLSYAQESTAWRKTNPSSRFHYGYKRVLLRFIVHIPKVPQEEKVTPRVQLHQSFRCYLRVALIHMQTKRNLRRGSWGSEYVPYWGSIFGARFRWHGWATKLRIYEMEDNLRSSPLLQNWYDLLMAWKSTWIVVDDHVTGFGPFQASLIWRTFVLPQLLLFSLILPLDAKQSPTYKKYRGDRNEISEG